MPPPWDKLRVPEPISWLIDKVNENKDIPVTALAVTHGDLHGDNLLVDGDQNLWVIDFERSGYGPILQDFTELESDILTRLAGLHDFDFEPLFRLGLWVAQSRRINEYSFFPDSVGARVMKTMKVISALRQQAYECTGESDARPYLWGLLLNAIFRATLLDPQKQKLSQQRALMLASIYCHRLDHWEEPWPPSEWKVQ
jgi:hypothetical protein